MEHERPNLEPVAVLYDDDCGICSALARVARRLDRRGRMEWVGFEEARRRGMADGLSDSELRAAFHVVSEAGRASGAEAIPWVLERMVFGRWPARWLRSSPSLTRALGAGYAFVVRHRHRISRACGLAPDSPDPRQPS